MKNNKIGLISAFWDAPYGEHPSLVSNEDQFFSFPPHVDEDIDNHLLKYNLPLIPCVDGHNVMVDSTITEHLGIDIKFCTSPNFVKDLAGRTIYTGYGPEAKDASQWRLNRHVSFPKNCLAVTEGISGHELIENVLFTRFRCLETSTQYEDFNHQIQLSYPAANLYPYKVRLDTFYQDGWRLPQTEMLFVNPDADITKAEQYGQSIMNIWGQMHDAGATYQEFLDKLNHSGATEKMFNGGCTLIPTIEATNGYFDVADDFSILKQRSGRAVEGLHDVLDYKLSAEPKGTIIDVVEPGYMTPDHIQPAKVIVSDGKRFDIEYKAKGFAMAPDIKLPHTRNCAQWGKTWIPTEPHHFSAPAIWSWGNQTGHFLQMKGPLWDPLHYYYACTDKVIHAFKNDLVEGSKTLAHVPAGMKKRFHPVVPMKGFDIMSLAEKNKNAEQDSRPLTGLTRMADTRPHCGVGYHPLPLSFEYELSYWSFPALNPVTRINEKPEHIQTAPVIHVKTPAALYKRSAKDISEFERLGMTSMAKDASGDPLEDYPQLHRYLSPYNETLARNLSSLVEGFTNEPTEPTETLLELSKEIGIPFYKEVHKMRQNAVERIKERNSLIDIHPDDYIKQEWTGKKEP